eukprot:10264478-Alexandrium_andersonii.AAC.2
MLFSCLVSIACACRPVAPVPKRFGAAPPTPQSPASRRGSALGTWRSRATVPHCPDADNLAPCPGVVFPKPFASTLGSGGVCVAHAPPPHLYHTDVCGAGS